MALIKTSIVTFTWVFIEYMENHNVPETIKFLILRTVANSGIQKKVQKIRRIFEGVMSQVTWYVLPILFLLSNNNGLRKVLFPLGLVVEVRNYHFPRRLPYTFIYQINTLGMAPLNYSQFSAPLYVNEPREKIYKMTSVI
jgi:hypothetical protein